MAWWELLRGRTTRWLCNHRDPYLRLAPPEYSFPSYLRFLFVSTNVKQKKNVSVDLRGRDKAMKALRFWTDNVPPVWCDSSEENRPALCKSWTDHSSFLIVQRAGPELEPDHRKGRLKAASYVHRSIGTTWGRIWRICSSLAANKPPHTSNLSELISKRAPFFCCVQ